MTDDCLGTYSIVNRNSSGNDGIAYNTFQEAANIAQPGDTIYLRSGTYTCYGQSGPGHEHRASNPAIQITTSGTSSNWITFKAFGNEEVIIDAEDYHASALAVSGDYIRLENLKATRSETPYGGGIIVYGGSVNSDPPEHIEIINCTTYGNDGTGIMTWRYVEHVTIDSCEAYDNNQGIGFRYDGSDKHGLGAMPDDQTEGARHSIIKNSLAYDNLRPNIGNADGFGIGFGYLCTLENNVTFNNGDDGFDIYSSNNCFVTGNIIFNHRAEGDGNGLKINTGGGGNHLVAGNIVFDNKFNGFDVSSPNSYTPNFGNKFFNNISYTQDINGYYFDGTISGTTHILRNNIGYNNGRDFRNNNMPAGSFDNNFNRFNANDISGSNSTSADPDFINPIVNIDISFQSDWSIQDKVEYIRNQVKAAFSLETDSPLIDAGTVIPGYHCDTPGEHPGDDGVEWFGSAPDIGAYEFNPGGNSNPVAHAGADQTITDSDENGAEQVTLDGSGSTDSDGTIQSYLWTENGDQIATGIKPYITLSTGLHTITLRVTDDDGASDTDIVNINITGNQAPVANAGSDQTVTDSDENGAEQVSLNGSGSTDSDGSIQSYLWTENGDQIATGINPNVTLSTGQHTISLTVTDDDGVTDSDTVNITIATNISSQYEGFGTATNGAEDAPGGYQTYHVTKLDDDGSVGTLRDAVSQGSRLIVFDIGGTITLTRTLNVDESYITIDGLTAPNPGITIVQPTGAGTVIMPNGKDAHDIIIRYLRNIGQGGHPDNSADIWGMDGMDGHVYNIIIDHVTGIASEDGIFDIYGEVSDVTISWSLITNTVTALHLSWSPQNRDRISLHHNVFAGNNERQVRMRHHNDLIDFVNNVIYGWGWIEGGAAGLHIGTNDGMPNDAYPTLNYENNVLHYVSGLHGDQDDAIIRDNPTGKIYFNGNILPSGETDNYDTSARHAIPTYATVTMFDADTLGDTVVPFAGTHYPTAQEQQLLNDIGSAIGGAATVNQNPNAHAGLDQTITDSDSNGSEMITLDGTASSDSDGTIQNYLWSLDGTPIANGPNPNVILPVGAHNIVLTVTDNGGATDTDTVEITVNQTLNQSPSANAGPDQTITDTDDTGAELVTLNGSNSSDPDGVIQSFIWTDGANQIAVGVNPSVTLSIGTHNITLTVTDDDGATSSDDVIITINPSQPTVYTITSTANSGGSITPGGAVEVNPDSSRTFAITADPGYQISSVLVDGASQGVISSYTFSDVAADHTIIASFTPIVPDNTMVGHWQFDETSGDTAADSSGFNNTATLINGLSWTDGIIDGALQFSQNNDAAEIPTGNFEAGSGAISLWIYPEAFSLDN
ncbi:MAG: hypothetical protein GY869_10845, partial [Planctomycetes bacterium]|nr:hypothetical protein [Planctomycetota bacterium]